MYEKIRRVYTKISRYFYINRYLKIFNVSDNCPKKTLLTLTNIEDKSIFLRKCYELKPKRYNFYLKEFLLSLIFVLYNILSITFFNKILFGTSFISYVLVLAIFIILAFSLLYKELKDRRLDFYKVLVSIAISFTALISLCITGTKFQGLNLNLKEPIMYDLTLKAFTIEFYQKGNLGGTCVNLSFIFSIIVFLFTIYLLIIGKKKVYEVSRFNNTYAYTLFVSSLLLIISLSSVFITYLLNFLLIPVLVFVIIYDIISFKRRNLIDVVVIFLALAMCFYLFALGINRFGGSGGYTIYKYASYL